MGLGIPTHAFELHSPLVLALVCYVEMVQPRKPRFEMPYVSPFSRFLVFCSQLLLASQRWRFQSTFSVPAILQSLPLSTWFCPIAYVQLVCRLWAASLALAGQIRSLLGQLFLPPRDGSQTAASHSWVWWLAVCQSTLKLWQHDVLGRGSHRPRHSSGWDACFVRGFPRCISVRNDGRSRASSLLFHCWVNTAVLFPITFHFPCTVSLQSHPAHSLITPPFTSSSVPKRSFLFPPPLLCLPAESFFSSCPCWLSWRQTDSWLKALAI